MKATSIHHRQSKTPISKGITQICSHYIEWSFNDKGLHLSTTDMEYITNALIENRLDGELCTIAPNGKTVNGRWNIQW